MSRDPRLAATERPSRITRHAQPMTRSSRERALSRIDTGRIVSILQSHLRGEIELQPTQVQAGKILLDRTLPTLQAVEAVQQDPRDQLQPTDLQAKLLALLERSPQIIKPLIDALLDRQPGMLDALLADRSSRATVVDQTDSSVVQGIELIDETRMNTGYSDNVESQLPPELPPGADD